MEDRSSLGGGGVGGSILKRVGCVHCGSGSSVRLKSQAAYPPPAAVLVSGSARSTGCTILRQRTLKSVW